MEVGVTANKGGLMSAPRPKPSSHEGKLYKLGNGINVVKPKRALKPLASQQNLLEIRDKSK